MLDPAGRHQRTERVDHPVLSGRPVDEHRHPQPEGLRRTVLCEHLASACAQPLNIVVGGGTDL
jgi:hypothetical protein